MSHTIITYALRRELWRIKDGFGRYLYEPGLMMGDPDTFMGHKGTFNDGDNLCKQDDAHCTCDYINDWIDYYRELGKAEKAEAKPTEDKQTSTIYSAQPIAQDSTLNQ